MPLHRRIIPARCAWYRRFATSTRSSCRARQWFSACATYRTRTPWKSRTCPQSPGPRARAPTHRRPRRHDRRKARYRLRRLTRSPGGQAQKVRVGEFAKSWIESKTLKLDSATARTYADALENHILPALGDYYYDALLPTDVQRWIDDALLRGWTSEKRGSKQDKTMSMSALFDGLVSTIIDGFPVSRSHLL